MAEARYRPGAVAVGSRRFIEQPSVRCPTHAVVVEALDPPLEFFAAQWGANVRHQYGDGTDELVETVQHHLVVLADGYALLQHASGLGNALLALDAQLAEEYNGTGRIGALSTTASAKTPAGRRFDD